MKPTLLLDTHVFAWMTTAPRRLSRDQVRVLKAAEAQGEPIGVSAMTLLELASLFARGRGQMRGHPDDYFRSVEADPGIVVLPITCGIATEVATLSNSVLRDPADLAIVATARVHGLRLLTSEHPTSESSSPASLV